MIYTCNNCNKEFKQKSNYLFHMNRKIPCYNKVNVNSTQNIEVNLPQKSTIYPQKSAIYPQKNVELLKKSVQNINNNYNDDKSSKIICQKCKKDFSRKYCLIKHQKDRCKIKNINDKDKPELDELKEENKKLKEEIAFLKQNVILPKVSKSKVSNKLINTNSHNVNSNNSITINNIIKFGDKDINITSQSLLDLLKTIHLNKSILFYKNQEDNLQDI